MDVQRSMINSYTMAPIAIEMIQVLLLKKAYHRLHLRLFPDSHHLLPLML
jgi:hypothetical protein